MSESAFAKLYTDASIAENAGVVRIPRRYMDDDGVLCASGDFCARLAMNPSDRDAAYRLRYEIFNLELGEGLESAHLSGRDTDEFDHICEHVLVEEIASGRIVGT